MERSRQVQMPPNSSVQFSQRKSQRHEYRPGDRMPDTTAVVTTAAVARRYGRCPIMWLRGSIEKKRIRGRPARLAVRDILSQTGTAETATTHIYDVRQDDQPTHLQSHCMWILFVKAFLAGQRRWIALSEVCATNGRWRIQGQWAVGMHRTNLLHQTEVPHGLTWCFMALERARSFFCACFMKVAHVRLVDAGPMTLFGNLFGSSKGGTKSSLFSSSNPFGQSTDAPGDASGARSDAVNDVQLDNAIATLERAKGVACL